VPTDHELVDLLDQVWASVADLGRGLTEPEWKLPTECPGWSVQDNLAHLSAIEARLLGRPEPDHELPPELPHVKNPFGRTNELFVDARRGWSGADVLAEFEDVTRARINVLRGYRDEDFAAESWTPVGPGTVRDLLPFRLFDGWVHEQDMRRATGRPGDLDTPVAANGLDRVVKAMPFVIGKQAAAPEGTTVVLSLAGPLAREVVVGVVNGRARILDREPDTPTVRLTLTTETLARLGCGRIDPLDTIAVGGVGIEGDEVLGRRVVESMNFLF
jgi:uncharacterized protein (TIGR03083 family)